jgi:hypothetical protein
MSALHELGRKLVPWQFLFVAVALLNCCGRAAAGPITTTSLREVDFPGDLNSIPPQTLSESDENTIDRSSDNAATGRLNFPPDPGNPLHELEALRKVREQPTDPAQRARGRRGPPPLSREFRERLSKIRPHKRASVSYTLLKGVVGLVIFTLLLLGGASRCRNSNASEPTE